MALEVVTVAATSERLALVTLPVLMTGGLCGRRTVSSSDSFANPCLDIGSVMMVTSLPLVWVELCVSPPPPFLIGLGSTTTRDQTEGKGV